MTEPIYAVGDIHGQLSELDRVLHLIEQDGGDDAQIVFLGDYVDRGPDSRGVIERIATGQAEGRNWTTILGNHDRFFAWFMEETPRHDPHLLIGYHWFHDRIGGRETLASYGLNFDAHTRLYNLHKAARDTVPQHHVTFLRGLKPMLDTPDIAFVHAGIRPNVALADQQENDLVWIRDAFHNFTTPHPKLIVHGHTVVDTPTHYGNRINLDSGAGYGKPLTAAVFEGTACWLPTQNGRVSLSP